MDPTLTIDELFDHMFPPAEPPVEVSIHAPRYQEPPPRQPAVVGVDLSLTGTGVAVSTGFVTTVKSKPTDDDIASRYLRLEGIVQRVVAVTPYDTALVVLEAPAYASKGGHAHDRSGLWWLLVDRLARARPQAAIVEIAPTSRAKYATGKGKASKEEVLLAVERRFGGWMVGNNNEADAVVLCAAGARALGRPIDTVPERNHVVSKTLAALLERTALTDQWERALHPKV